MPYEKVQYRDVQVDRPVPQPYTVSCELFMKKSLETRSMSKDVIQNIIYLFNLQVEKVQYRDVPVERVQYRDVPVDKPVPQVSLNLIN